MIKSTLFKATSITSIQFQSIRSTTINITIIKLIFFFTKSQRRNDLHQVYSTSNYNLFMNMGGVKITFSTNTCSNSLNLMRHHIICIYHMLLNNMIFRLAFCHKKGYKKTNIVCLSDGALLVFKST